MANPKQLVLSLRFVPNPLVPQWHAALIVNGQMDQVYVGDSVEAVLLHATSRLNKLEFPAGTRIIARFDIDEPGDKPEGA